MKIKFLNKLRGIVLAFLSLFSKKKRNSAVLSLNTTVSSDPVPMEQIKLTSRPATGLVDITQMLDQECAELYPNRSPFIRY